MERRAFLAGTLATLVEAATSSAQTGTRPVRIGRLSPLAADADGPMMKAFRAGLQDLGWVEGRTFVVESRFADGKADRLAGIAAELVRQQVDLILSGSSPAALAAKRATSTIPIVMVTTGDPVRDGIVASLARPGGNVTGVTAIGQTLDIKRLELLKEAVPGVGRVGVLVNPDDFYTERFMKERAAAGRSLGLELRVVEAREPGQLEPALTALAGERVGALLVLTNALYISQHRRIVELVARSRLPAVYGERQFVDAGGLMFYGAGLAALYREAAAYADKILKGGRPADLPVAQPTRLELVINLQTARVLGLTLPQSVLLRADEVIGS
jgi:putative ABC transport system substrate-binding protein